jgi:hypothetical protein
MTADVAPICGSVGVKLVICGNSKVFSVVDAAFSRIVRALAVPVLAAAECCEL